MRGIADYVAVFEAIVRAKLAHVNLVTVPYPFRVNMAVTYHCNYRCKMCDIWKIYRESPDLRRMEMTVDDYDRIFEALSPNVFWLGLTGGEPFLRKDLVDIIHLAYSRLRRLRILELTTNGSSPRALEEAINEVLDETKIPFFTVGVSVDGPPLLHDNIRGTRGAWNRALTSYKKIREIANSYPNLSPHISYTISRYNAGNIHNFLAAIQGQEIDIESVSVTLEHVGHFYHNIQDTGSAYYQRFIDRAKADIHFLTASERRYSRTRKKNPVALARRLFYSAYLRSAIRYLDNPARMVIPCAALIGSCFIDPFGNIYPCSIYGRRLGNLRESTFSMVWYSRSATSLREYVKRGKCPNCWSPCEAEPSFLMSLPKALLSRAR